MTRSILAGILALGVCAAGHAEEKSTSYSVQVGGGYESLDLRGSRNRVQQYDGKAYRTGRGDLQYAGDNDKGLLDIGIYDLGTDEENGRFHLDYKDTVRLSGYVNNMHHRQSLVRTLVTVNDQATPNPYLADRALGEEYMFRRLEGDIKLALHGARNWARMLSLEYWAVNKVGDQTSRFNSGLYPAWMDNLTQDVTVGLGTNLGDKGAVTNDFVVRNFMDSAQLASLGGVNYTKRPYPGQNVYSDEVRLRYDLAKGLALTGVLNGRERHNNRNGYFTRSYVATLASSYQVSRKLSVTGRVYGRYEQVYENQQYMSPLNNFGNGNEFDENAFKAELNGSYRITEKLRARAGYKLELAHRRDAPAEQFSSLATYSDGTIDNPYTRSNTVAKEDTKHILNASLDAELPLGIAAEAAYQKLRANRGAFENQPTDRDRASLSVAVPLPQNVRFSAGAEFDEERSRSSYLSAYKQTQKVLRAGLDWDVTNKVSVGADYSRDYLAYRTEGWFGVADSPVVGALEGGFLIHEGGMVSRQKSDTAGAHAHVVLPKGFQARGSAAYTRALGQVGVTQMTPTTLTPINNAGGFTPAGTTVTDLAPSDVRIWRTSLALEYTPEKYKQFTARAGYRVDDWVDRLDSLNSGRTTIYSANLSAKF